MEESMLPDEKIAVVIPARYGSMRFPGKVLARISGKCMIQHVWESAMKARNVGRVIIATDDERIIREIERFGGESVLTGKDIASGTDRVAVVAQNIDAEIIINVQSDEPLLEPETIENLALFFRGEKRADIGTVVRPVRDNLELTDPNVVKAVLNTDRKVLYFSRSLIPHHPDPVSLSTDDLHRFRFYAHVGIYAYRRQALFRLASLSRSDLEVRESLEQLRALENGLEIYAVERDICSVGVDHPSKIPIVEELLAKKRGKSDGN